MLSGNKVIPLARVKAVSYTHLDVYKRQDFHIYHQPPEIRVGSQFAEKPVVDFAAAQKLSLIHI